MSVLERILVRDRPDWHICDSKPHYACVRVNHEGKWMLILHISYDGIQQNTSMPVSFCPFCGEKLR